MITTKSDSNSSKYIALFEDAFNFLKEHALQNDEFPATLEDREIRKQVLQDLVDAGVERFSSVQEYFSHIQDLLLLGGKKYLMLPLDEPVFEIDANKREILVPSEFKKNGISVQGDEIAESLIFKINRFFDYADLREMVPQVQWENAAKETGTSSIFVVDDSRNADYLYLMWPLKEEITKHPGTVKFSLRFYNVVGNELAYSFSTKIAAATINASHDFSYEKLSTNVIDAESNFAAAIKNSKNTAAEDAATPYFILNLDEVAQNIPATRTADEENADYIEAGDVPHLEAYIDADNNPIQYLRVQAATSDTGLISYSWVYRDTVDTSVQDGVTYNLNQVTDASEIYLVSQDITPVAHKVYYKKVNDVYTISEFDGNDVMYEKYSVIAVRKNQVGRRQLANNDQVLDHVAGVYQAKATNSVGGNTSDALSYAIVFPAPEVLDFTEEGNLPANAFLNGSNSGSLSVAVVIDENGAKDTYEWEYSTTLTGPFTPISGETSTLTPTEKAKLSVNEAGNVLTIDNFPGFYRVRAISTRNYEQIKKLSDVCKVTPALQAPTIIAPTKDTAVSSLYAAATLAIAVEDFESGFLSEGVTYQWYKWVNGELEAIEGATNAELVVPQGTDDAFCCEATNHMGESVATARSRNFSVQPFRPTPAEPEPSEPDEPTPVEPDEPTPSEPVADPSLALVASKLLYAPSDPSIHDVSQTNQNNIEVSVDNTYDGEGVKYIVSNTDELQYFMSTNEYQQDAEHQWIALDIDTGLPSIVGATWGSYTLTQDDADEAASLGLGAGHIIYWAKADVLAETPAVITIGAEGYSDTKITIAVNYTTG